ncbi:MAG: hypothetical protein Q8940_16980, partial [Bacteroidota bacterium]|nr:hypothetical protein [Bacteroidota bacterium]
FYDQKTLWGYIDGGADIYLEYGFDKMIIEEITQQNHHFKVEIYKMKNPEAAFGIYSVSKADCPKSDSLAEYCCITSYQTTAFKGEFFISVINDSGDKESIQLGNKLASIVLGKIKDLGFRLPDLLTQMEFASLKNEVKFFNGILGLQNSLPEMADQFENYKNYKIYFLPIEKNGSHFNLFVISFADKNNIKDYLEHIGLASSDNGSQLKKEDNGEIKSSQRVNDNTIIYYESTLTDSDRTNYTDVINRYIR